MPADPDYCLGKAAPAGSNLHYALLFEAGEQKQRLLPLFALHYEISDCLTASTDPGVIRVKLQWWAEELGRLSAGGARHPVTVTLQEAAGDIETIAGLFLRHLAAIESIASGYAASIPFDEWYAHLSRELGQPWVAVQAEESSIGAICLLELVQDSLPLLSRGHRLYPAGLLEQHGLSYDDLVPSGTGRISPLFGMVVDRIANQFDNSYAELKRENVWYELILNRLARTVCTEIREDGYRLLKHRIALTPIRKFWIAIRTRYLG